MGEREREIEREKVVLVDGRGSLEAQVVMVSSILLFKTFLIKIPGMFLGLFEAY